MQYLIAESTSPAFNLAMEELLMQRLDIDSSGIFYLWKNSPSVILGKHQNAYKEVNIEYCKEHSINICRRNSGGGAVYHDLGNLNFSFITKNDVTCMGNFGRFMEPIVSALSELGIQSEFSSRNDIAINDMKICGTAQFLDGDKLLHHGCILVHTDKDILSKALVNDLEKFKAKGVDSHRARVANLKEFLPIEWDNTTCMQKLTDVLVKYCADEKFFMDTMLIDEAKELAHNKYCNSNWTFGKFTQYTRCIRQRFPWGRFEISFDIQHGIIDKCKIFGDFFAYKELVGIESLLEQNPAQKTCLSEFFNSFPIEEYIKDANRRDLANLINEQF